MHLLSRVIDRGTATRSAADIADALDNRGVTLSIGVTRHLLSIVCMCLADDFDSVLDLLGDVVMTPTVPESELVTRKGEVITALRQDDDNPAVRAVEGLMALLYGEQHPYGRRVKGSIESVEAASRAQLLALHARPVQPVCAAVPSIVGDVDAGARSRRARRRRLAAGAAQAPPALPSRAPSQPCRGAARSSR